MKVSWFLVLATLLCTSCRPSVVDYASDWSKEVKRKVLEDVSKAPDKILVDTSKENFKEITFYTKGVRTRFLGVRKSTGDTIFSIFYSKDQNFELIRELCPGIERNFEGIKYKGESFGLAEFRFCDGKIKEQGFRFKGNVGVWKEWDENGDLIREKDYEQVEKLDGLREIN